MPYPFQLPALGYAHAALEPTIDARTMEIHHGKHHAAYTANLNKALEGHAALHVRSDEERHLRLVGERSLVHEYGFGYAGDVVPRFVQVGVVVDVEVEQSFGKESCHYLKLSAVKVMC